MLTGKWLIVTLASAASTLAAKRGLAWPSDNPYNPAIFTSSKVDWLYNWGTTNTALNTEFPFYVMQWGSGGIAQLASEVNAAKPPAILGFNEPDNTGQSNLSPTDAANLWMQYIQPLAGQGIKLISPAITNGGAPSGIAWMDSFVQACTGCTIDGIAIHWYGGWIDDFEAFVESAKKYNKQIYLTEFGFSWDAQATADSFLQFLPLAMNYLDNEPMVEKYAFFGAFYSGTGKDMINQNGTLTAVGQLYIS